MAMTQRLTIIVPPPPLPLLRHLLLLLLPQYSFVAMTTVAAPDLANSSSSYVMVLVDQLGRLAQFPVDAKGHTLQEAAYNPFDGSSVWSQKQLSERPSSCVGASAAGTGSSTEL
jgi:hypothetical protein